MRPILYLTFAVVDELLIRATTSLLPYQGHVVLLDNRGDRDRNQVLFVQAKPLVLDHGSRHATWETMAFAVPQTTAQLMNYMHWDTVNRGDAAWLWMHDDAWIKDPAALLTLGRALADRERSGEPWGVLLTAYDALAAYSTEAASAVDGWDQRRYPYYFLDNAYHAAVEQAGFPVETLPEVGALVGHDASQTLRRLPEHAAANQFFFPASEALWARDPRNPKNQPSQP